MTTFPTIPITQFYGNPVSYESRNSKTELGKNGVIGRSKTHSQNAVRSRYSISAIVKTPTEKTALQTFLLTNKGKPFRFNFDGTQSAGLFTCHTWKWTYKVLTSVSGVYELTADFNEVFRPAQLIPNTLLVPLGVARGVGFDPLVISYVIQPPLGVARGVGFDPVLSAGNATLQIPLGEANATGTDPSLTGSNPSVTAPTGFGSGVGFDPTLVPGAITITVDLGVARGVGFDPNVIQPPTTTDWDAVDLNTWDNLSAENWNSID